MKTLVVLLLFAAAVLSEEIEELPLAEECDPETCLPPNCRCSSTDIPGGLRPRDTPQFVITSFDGGINVINIESFRSIFYNRVNRNQCPVGVNFFVNHEYTNYRFVNELYNQGYEIGLHSISRQTPQTYWAEASYDVIKEEIADQRVQMSHFANIPVDEIRGVRMPFLQLAGNNSFHVMSDFGLTYDASWPSINLRDPGLWPYTLDYATIQDCPTLPCPTSSIPGVWVSPILSWTDLDGFSCSTVDGCIFVPDRDNEQLWFEFILSNFERHYLGNRAPFSFNIDEAYMRVYPALRRAYIRFFDLINTLNDVFMVNANEVIEWVKDPVPVEEYLKKPCREFTPTTCPFWSCVLTTEHSPFVMTYWVEMCNICPRTYPWVGNPLGQ